VKRIASNRNRILFIVAAQKFKYISNIDQFHGRVHPTETIAVVSAFVEIKSDDLGKFGKAISGYLNATRE